MADTEGQRARARIGTVIRGKYRIESLLATGSMACVYSATHRNASRVALKVLHPRLARDPAMRERFRREGYFANSIEHAGVPRAIDDDETEDGCAYLVMELLEGETLEQRRARMGGKLPLPFVLTVADSVLDVLAAAHEKKILHRDLKPDNVFVTFSGQVKLLDFGVARWDDGQKSSEMTAAGMVVGTPAFMPPEQALGKRDQVDAQSDIWAIGAMLFVAIAGETVHAGGDAKARLIATARTPARKLQEVAPFVPRGVAGVVDRALAFEKKERWPDAKAMREALRWARRSLDAFAMDSESEGQLHRRPSMHPEPPSTTRAGYQEHEEPTRRGISLAPPEEEDEPTLARAYRDSERDVLTSAPAITREVPQSATASGPVFSLRREKDDDDAGRDDGDVGATTEPQLRAAPPSGPAPAPARDAHATLPGMAPIVAPQVPPRGMGFAGSEATRTMPMGAPVRPAAGAPAMQDAPPRASNPPLATMKSSSVPPEVALAIAGSPAPVSAHGPYGAPPQAHTSSGSLRPLASSAPPTPSSAEATAPRSVTPGPVLASLVEPTRGSMGRTLLSLALGLGVLGGATALIVRQQRAVPAAPSARVEAPAATSVVAAAAPPAASAPVAAPSAMAAPSAIAAPEPAVPSATAPPPAATAPSATATAVAAAAPATRPRPRVRPRPAAAASAASSAQAPASGSAGAAATSDSPTAPEPSPTPAEAPKPATTPETPPAAAPVPTPVLDPPSTRAD